MTREEASNILDDYDVNFDGHTAREIAEAFEVAFRALEQEPCEDSISRQAAIDIVDSHSKSQSNVEDVTQDIISDIVALPPVHSQPNKEDIHREREQAYMCGFEDGSRKYRTEQSEDAISRSDMLDAIGHGTTYTSEELQEIIKGLPSVNPQPKTGHWKYYQNEKGDWINECSVCGSDAGVGYQYPYCPNCGARMSEISTDSESEDKE